MTMMRTMMQILISSNLLRRMREMMPGSITNSKMMKSASRELKNKSLNKNRSRNSHNSNRIKDLARINGAVEVVIIKKLEGIKDSQEMMIGDLIET